MMVSRTGYSGERGYERFMHAAVVVDVWQELLQRGPAYGLRPVSFGGLEMVHLVPSAVVAGTALELNAPTIQCHATAARIPFVDPQRKRLHAR